MEKKILTTPLKEADMRALRVGDVIYLAGTIYTARDMAHLKLRALHEGGQPLPVDLNGGAIFHAGPVALRNDDQSWRLNVIGPTTSIRMEPHAEIVGQWGVKAVIGKGGMAQDTVAACQKYGYVYLQAAPGCAATLAQGIRGIGGVHYLEFGMPEAIWELDAECFGPLVVAMDTHGKSLYNDIKQSAYQTADALYPKK